MDRCLTVPGHSGSNVVLTAGTVQLFLPRHSPSTTDTDDGTWQLLVAKLPHDPVGVP
jgi:hypothetical protein